MHTTQPICDGDVKDGIDIATPIGTPVLAPASGIVKTVWNDKTYGCGLSVMIDLPDGAVVGFTWLSDTMVRVGDAVKQNQVIAHSGQSGNAGSPKLHYTLFTAERIKVDPRSWNQNAGEPERNQKRFTDPADLQKALDMVDASDQPENIKRQEKLLLADRFDKARALADAKYKDNLKKALDDWYANGKNWRKIPADVWAKLREADQGRIKNGIDPEIRLPDPAHHEDTSQK